MDFYEGLQMLKKDFGDDYIQADTMTILEDINPNLSDKSRKYNQNKKQIFRQYISEQSAYELVTLVSDVSKYNIGSLLEYKQNIKDKCEILCNTGQNPTEMLIYSIKGLSQDMFKHSILDELKNLREIDETFIESYKNILVNWTWNECIDCVLKSIQELQLFELVDEVYYVFENNIMLRKEAAITIINIGADKKFTSIINFLVAQNNETRQELTILKDVMYYMGNNTSSGSTYIYRSYLGLRAKNEVKNILIVGIRTKLVSEIYDHIEKVLKNPQSDRTMQSNVIRLLGRTNKSSRSFNILKNALTYKHLKQSEVKGAIGIGDIGLQIDTALDKGEFIESRIRAIISLSSVKDYSVNDISNILNNLLEEDNHSIKIAAMSVKAENGDENSIIELFKYLVSSNDDDVVWAASNQIKRLRGSNSIKLNQVLINIAEQLLAHDDSNNVIKILDIYSTGIPTDDIALVFLKKLNNTKHKAVKEKILTFFEKNISIFRKDIQMNIEELIVTLSRDSEVGTIAMKSLQKITVLKDKAPTMEV